jgi:outer membrane receptor protein involved in Fe transport
VAVLNRTAGVRVRQAGGLGSRTTVQLNGLTGQAVRTYYDGIPIEIYGGSIQLNNIPVNNVERIDVYKGVIPIDVGTDALAGGINIISRQLAHDFMDASYQFGSFNTHVASLTASKKLGDHLLLSVAGFYNHADNNYHIRTMQRTPDFKEEEVKVERFHSAHQSAMIMGSIGMVDLDWADQLTYGINYNERFDEIQHGVRIGNRAIGEANVQRNALVQTLRYRKGIFGNRFNIDYFGNFSIATDFVDDSTTNVYDWYGNVFAQNQQGSEILADPSARDGKTNTHVHRLNLSYNLLPHHQIKLSSFYSHERVAGNDPYATKINEVDPNTIPSRLQRSISGLSYDSKWLDSKLETIVFGKYYYYKQNTSDFNQLGGTNVFEYAREGSETGYGVALKYSILKDFFIRTSFERAIRIPNRLEVFGDFITIAPNFSLKPEKSKNLNVGGFYKHTFSPHKYISLDANWFLRDQTDLIRLQVGRNENDPAKFINEDEANATGIELSLTTVPVKNLDLTFNYTYQEVVKDGTPNANNTNGIGSPMPNIPSNFYNISARYQFTSPLSKTDDVTFFGYFLFVDDFDLILQGNTSNEENIIPKQRQLDFGITYSIYKPGLTLTLQSSNILDQEVFDNYRVPKPGRNFSFKIRYLIQEL